MVRNFNFGPVREVAALLVKITTDSECRTQCAESARRHFSLEAGVATYEKIYCDLEKGSQ